MGSKPFLHKLNNAPELQDEKRVCFNCVRNLVQPLVSVAILPEH